MSDPELMNLAKNIEKCLESDIEINPRALKLVIRDYIIIKQDMMDAKPNYIRREDE